MAAACTQARTVAARLRGYATRTMALEAQDIDEDRQSEWLPLEAGEHNPTIDTLARLA